MYLISYDLHKPERDYDDVITTIKSLGRWAKLEESVWIVETTRSAADCRDAVRDAAANEATIFVAAVRQEWASFGLSSDVTTWLKDPARRW